MLVFSAGEFCPDPTFPEKEVGERLLDVIIERKMSITQTPDGMLWLSGDLELQDIQEMSRHVCPLVWALFAPEARRQAISVIQRAQDAAKGAVSG